jgi:hypothetical protein
MNYIIYIYILYDIYVYYMNLCRIYANHVQIMCNSYILNMFKS